MDVQWLRIVVVGHVDHGKSTLIGRLLHDSGALPDPPSGGLGSDLEWALLLDHLREEREQERTIDSTQAFFATSKRVYRIIDVPGHREFLKNMVTGAAQADAAILVVDVEAGVLEQTRRHVAMLAMLGQRQVIVTINKMDRVDGRRQAFEIASSSTLALLDQMGIVAHRVIPISARHGWNLASHPPSGGLEWYRGPALFDALDSLRPPAPLLHQSLRFPVQDVYDLNARNGSTGILPAEDSTGILPVNRRILVGRIESGRLAAEQTVMCLPSGRAARITSVEKFLENRGSAEAGECIGLTLEEPLESHAGCLPYPPAGVRGDVLCDPSSLPPVARRFEANLFWLSDRGWKQGDPLVLRCTTQEAPCRIESIRQRIDSSTFEIIETDAARLDATEVAHAVLAVERPIVVEEFTGGSPLGRFVLIKNQELSAGGTITRVLLE